MILVKRKFVPFGNARRPVPEADPDGWARGCCHGAVSVIRWPLWSDNRTVQVRGSAGHGSTETTSGQPSRSLDSMAQPSRAASHELHQ